MNPFCLMTLAAASVLVQNGLAFKFRSQTATCNMTGPSVQGLFTFYQKFFLVPVQLSGTARNLSSGQHGIHVHEIGDLGNNCLAAGPHYNPFRSVHGGPLSIIRHAGDFGNIVADESGVAVFKIVGKALSLQSLLQRALVIHQDPDDLGKGKGQAKMESLLTGNSGRRVGCCIITQN